MRTARYAALLFAFIGVLSTGCAGRATDQEVEKMCLHLAELRGNGNASESDPAEELKKCKADKMVTDVSSETAACRIAAKDVDTFWNKCR